MVEVRFTLPYLEEMDWNKAIEVYLYEAAENGSIDTKIMDGKSFLPKEALEFAVKLAEAAIKILSEDELDGFRKTIKGN